MTELTSECLSSRQRTFEDEIVEYMPQLKLYAYSLTRTSSVQADDLVQQTVYRALKNKSRYDDQSTMRAWLFQILKNEFFTILRKGKREVSLDPTLAENFAVVEVFDAIDDEEESASEFLMIVDFLAHLTIELRDALVAIKYLDLSYERTAFVLGTEIGTIKSRVNRSIETIRRLMSDRAQPDYDISAWATATSCVRREDPYLEIAQAYEDIYKFVQERGDSVKKGTLPQKNQMLEEAWTNIDTTNLYFEEDINDLIRDD